MKLGVVFPQTEIGSDPAVIMDYAQAAEGLGYDYLLVYDHVLGAHPAREPKLTGPYTHEHPFHEPMVLFGFLAAVTTRLELVTGILILPQRQTALDLPAETLELAQDHGALHGVHATAHADPSVVVAALLAVCADLAQRLGQRVVVGENRAAVTITAQWFAREEAGAADG